MRHLSTLPVRRSSPIKVTFDQFQEQDSAAVAHAINASF
jgi:hypothetical protein